MVIFTLLNPRSGNARTNESLHDYLSNQPAQHAAQIFVRNECIKLILKSSIYCISQNNKSAAQLNHRHCITYIEEYSVWMFSNLIIL